MFDKGLLKRMQRPGRSQSFDRCDRSTFVLHGEGQAAINPLAVHQYGAGGTCALITALFRSSKSEMIAHKVQKCVFRKNRTAVSLIEGQQFR